MSRRRTRSLLCTPTPGETGARSRLCEKVDSVKGQYKAFVKQYRAVQVNKKKILNSIIDKTPGLRMFLIIHSAFDVKPAKEYDWLEMYMITKLMPTSDDVYQLFNPERIPQDIMDKLKIFKPEQILFDVDLIRMEYGMWRRDATNRVTDPINIINTDFDGVNIIKQRDVAKEIARYKIVESAPVRSVPSDWLEDDLPF